MSACKELLNSSFNCEILLNLIKLTENICNFVVVVFLFKEAETAGILCFS